MKRLSVLPVVLLVAVLVLTSVASAGSIVNMPFVWGDWSGYYTGEVDSNNIPYGHGLFESITLRNNETWRFIGEWKDGLPNGDGAIYYDDCSIDTGTFQNGELIKGRHFAAASIGITDVVVETRSLSNEVLYIGNKKTTVFHQPSCHSVETMSEKNKVEFASREEAIEMGYRPCGSCHP